MRADKTETGRGNPLADAGEAVEEPHRGGWAARGRAIWSSARPRSRPDRGPGVVAVDEDEGPSMMTVTTRVIIVICWLVWMAVAIDYPNRHWAYFPHVEGAIFG